MCRPRLTIGTYGEITTRRRPSGRVEARARYRDWDGATRLVQASGDTAAAATHALKAKCVDRNLIAPSARSLKADSPFPILVVYWLQDIELEDRLSTATRQVGTAIELIFATSARIGEVLAIRRRNTDLSVPFVRITGTIISPKGELTARQDHPKPARSRRTIQLPGFAAMAVQRLSRELNTIDPEALLFCSRRGTPLTTNNVRRQLRHVIALAGIESMTLHKFRRTVATTINESVGVASVSQLGWAYRPGNHDRALHLP